MNKLIPLLFFFGWVLNAQHQDKVDFYTADISLEPIPKLAQINGLVTYSFEVLTNVDSVFLDAKNMEFSSVLLDSKKVKFKSTPERITIFENFEKGTEHSLTLEYIAKPKQTLYFLGWNDGIEKNEQIWTQGQGKYTSHWLPSFDDMEEKVAFDLNITANEKYTVVANGHLAAKSNEEPKAIMWSFDMEKPMSSYLLAFAIGMYDKQELKSKSGIPIENYYYPEDSLKVEPTYRYTKEIFDFLEKEIGVPYPWQNYKQIPVRDFLYAGMENTTATIFSDTYLIDSTAFIDKNYVNVNAHELAHQWFGNLVTEKDGDHHWLHEGFATYYAYLAEKEIFGDDHFYWKLYESLRQLEDIVVKGEGQALTNPKASSLIFYEKGAWALYMLRNQIGEIPFRSGIQQYLKKYRFKNATISDFLGEMESTAGQDLAGFRREWLDNPDFSSEKAKKQLQKDCKSLDLLFSMEEELADAQSDDINYQKYWDATNSEYFKKHLIENYQRSFLFDGLRKAFQSNSIIVRQAILNGAPSNDFLPKDFLLDFLKEESYSTIEMALFQLWRGYPEDRAKYLDATANIVGLPNKNVRLLWLMLAMLTETYNGLQTKVYFDELSSYTSPEYGFEIRQGAFFYLKEVFGFDNQSLSNLVKATTHHSWQFRQFAREVLDGLLQDEDYKSRLRLLANELKPSETRYLKSKLNIE